MNTSHQHKVILYLKLNFYRPFLTVMYQTTRHITYTSITCLSLLKGHSGAELHIYFLVRLESIYYQIFFYSKIVPNCAVAK